MADDDDLEDLKRRLVVAERERNSAIAAAEETEERFRTVLEGIGDFFYVLDHDWRFLFASRSALEVWGKRQDEVLGRGFLDSFPEAKGSAAYEAHRRVMGTGAAECFETVSPVLNRWIEVDISPTKRGGLSVAFRDIEDRKRAEAAQRALETNFRALFESIDEGFTIMQTVRDDDGRLIDLIYLEANRAYSQHTGFQAYSGLRVKDIVPNIEDDWIAYYDRVSTTGVSEEKENFNADLNRWFRTQASRIGPKGSPLIGVVFEDVTERKLAEQVLRESEERQAFLLKLSDALRPLRDPAEIKAVATSLLGEQLSVNRAFYAHASEGRWFVTKGYEKDIEPLPDRPFDMATYGQWIIDDFAAGKRLIVSDMSADARFAESERKEHLDLQIRAEVALPLVKEGELLAMLVVQVTSRRDWREQELTLMEETAERTWAAVEQARAEAKLHRSEARFRQFANASSDAMWIRESKSFEFEYASPAVRAIFGVTPEAILADARLLHSLIVPEERDAVASKVERIGRGERIVHDYRILRPTDQSFRWIRSTGFPLLDERGQIRRIAAIASDITEAKLSAEHQAILLSELQHRVRNIMAMVYSIATRTARSASTAADYADTVAGRIRTLARVQALLTRAANVGVSLGTIVEDELSAQAQHASQFTMRGPSVTLSPKAAEVLTLALHELATNALKYGALSTDKGHVDVTWSVIDKSGGSWLNLRWQERGARRRKAAPSEPRRRGFGSELIEGRIPYELGGRARIEIGPDGAECQIEFALNPGASVLETDAPKRSTAFGGALDMTGASDLSGQRILVVEDDFFLATDTARALRGAGAQVLGPCPTEDGAVDQIAEHPTGAVVDINLGSGPFFKLAEILKRDGIPFVFITGYDGALIPHEFADVPRLEKPVELKQIVNVLAGVLQTDVLQGSGAGNLLRQTASVSREQAHRARALAEAEERPEVITGLRAYAEKLDKEAFAFEQQAVELNRTVATTHRLTSELRELVEQARARLAELKGKNPRKAAENSVGSERKGQAIGQ